MTVSETYSPLKTTTQGWTLDSSFDIENITFSENMSIPVPLPSENSSNSTVLYFETSSLVFGTSTTTTEDRVYTVSYGLTACESGVLTEYQLDQEYSVPFSLKVNYNYGDALTLTGNYTKNVEQKGNIEYTWLGNQSC